MELPKAVTAEEVRDDAVFRRAVRKGMETASLGKTVPFAEVRTWLLSWGNEDEKLPPECK